MARLFGFFFLFFAWLLAISFLLVVGPFIWLPYIVIAILVFTCAVILHAIAHVYTKGGAIEFVDEAIISYPAMLIRAFILIKNLAVSSFSSDNETLSVNGADGSQNATGTLAEDILETLFFLFIAFVIWFVIFFVLKRFGIDILEITKQNFTMQNIQIWAGVWVVLGTIGFLLHPLIRFLLVAPLLIVIALLWAFVGLVFFVPRLFRSMTEAIVAAFRFMISGGRTADPAQIVINSFQYYFDGFKIIFMTVQKGDDEDSDRNTQGEIKLLGGLSKSFSYLLLYIPITLILVIGLRYLG